MRDIGSEQKTPSMSFKSRKELKEDEDLQKIKEEDSDDEWEDSRSFLYIPVYIIPWIIFFFSVMFIGYYNVSNDIDSNFKDEIDRSMMRAGEQFGNAFSNIFVSFYEFGERSVTHLNYLFMLVVFGLLGMVGLLRLAFPVKLSVYKDIIKDIKKAFDKNSNVRRLDKRQ